MSVAFVIWVLMVGALFYMFGRTNDKSVDNLTPPWLQQSWRACDYEPVACGSNLIGYFYTFPGYQHPDGEKKKLKAATFSACLSETPYLCQLAINTHYGLLTANEQLQYLAASCRSGDPSACETTGPQKVSKWATYLRRVVVFFYRVYAWLTSRNWMQAAFDECQKGFGGACAAHMRSLWFTDRGDLVFTNPKIPKILEAGCSTGTDSLCKFLFGLIDTQKSPELELQLMTKACGAGDLQACSEIKSAQH
ncbi:MAG: hypothetical protein V4760_02300 [Bdellovibrionota bacterium]